MQIGHTLSASVLFITLGCVKNEVDTDRMRALLLERGAHEVQTTQDADVIIINTCSFLAAATSESIEATLALADEVNEGVRSKPIIMCGCVPSRYGEALPDELPEVAAFVKTQDEDKIVEVVQGVLAGNVHGQDSCQVMPTPTLDDTSDYKTTLLPQVYRTLEGGSAYVKISDGCDRYCSFCAIPYIRGHYASRPPAEILAEAAALLKAGVRELVLIGQDTGIWGSDFAEPKTLAWLLREVAKVAAPYKAWIRVLYLQPEGMTDELIATIRDTPQVLNYIDIPIQHCDASILKAMNRSGSKSELAALFAYLRQEIPHMILRTTGLVGFPGETQEQFDELCDFMNQMEFDYISVFGYSQEEGTRAASLTGQVDDDTILERTQELTEIAETLGFAQTARHVGEVVEVLIDGIEQTEAGQEFVGHAWFQAPDCDGAVHIASGDLCVGDMVRVRLVDSFCYELVGELIDE